MVALGSLKASLTRKYSVASVKIDEKSPLGQHIRRRRYELGQLQKEAAKAIGVTPETIWNWENGKSEPFTNYYPAIIRYIGYNPIPLKSGTLAERLFAARVTLGFSYRSLGKFLKVSEETVAAWETEVNKPTKKSLVILEKLWGLYKGSNMK